MYTPLPPEPSPLTDDKTKNDRGKRAASARSNPVADNRFNRTLYVFRDSSHNVGKGDLKWHTRVKQQISDFQIPAQVWHWQDGSSIAKSLQEPPTKFVTSYLEIGYISCVFPSRNLCPISMLLGAL
ncbi:hypothetical protein PV328_007835 [Microctonus aethiopoides]|uniref:Uncharacterized protein n=1 Tax=Microctonus aethiopoides TaxID=144406 RepID=A0AA39EZY1_9HYME|nr:hypothetical protein PV328_007835 [Microctonus aethiopoides]